VFALLYAASELVTTVAVAVEKVVVVFASGESVTTHPVVPKARAEAARTATDRGRMRADEIRRYSFGLSSMQG
jgi:hypothetical protein